LQRKSYSNLLRVLYVCLEKKSNVLHHQSRYWTLDFLIETMTISRRRRIQTPIEYCMSFKKCQTIPIMTLIYSISSMDEYVEFRHAISSSISVRLKCAKYLGVKSCYRIATERIYNTPAIFYKNFPTTAKDSFGLIFSVYEFSNL